MATSTHWIGRLHRSWHGPNYLGLDKGTAKRMRAEAQKSKANEKQSPCLHWDSIPSFKSPFLGKCTLIHPCPKVTTHIAHIGRMSGSSCCQPPIGFMQNGSITLCVGLAHMSRLRIWRCVRVSSLLELHTSTAVLVGQKQYTSQSTTQWVPWLSPIYGWYTVVCYNNAV